jgi:hypothetical protein
MPRPNDCLEIHESRFQLGLYVAGGIVMILGSLFMAVVCVGLLSGLLGSPPTTIRGLTSPIFVLLIGVVGIVLFGLITVQMASRLFSSRTPVLFLARDSFKDIRISSEWIPWPAILSLKNYRDTNVHVDVDPRFMRTLRLNATVRFACTLTRLRGYRGLFVATFSLENMSTNTLLDLMRERIDRVDHRLFEAEAVGSGIEG